jgi:hypothetical protein
MAKITASLCTLAVVALLACGGESGKSSSRGTYPRFASNDNTLVHYQFPAALNPGLSGDALGHFSGDTIRVSVPHNAPVTALVAEFVSNSARVEVNGAVQQSGMSANNFTTPVTYVVTADNGDVRSYQVTVEKALNNEKRLISFSLNGAAAMIDEDLGTVNVNLAPRTSIDSLIASFETTGSSVTVDGAVQHSGITANRFTDPVTYIVIAEDGTRKEYLVSARVQTAPWNDIVSFAFYQALNPSLTGDARGIVGASSIEVELPHGSPLAGLVASFETTGDSVRIGGVYQEAGVTVNDFGAMLTYIVTAEDRSVKTYDVRVTVARSDARSITSFSLAGESAGIDESAGAITVDFPLDAGLSGLVASFSHSGVSVRVNNTEQESGITANDFSSPLVYAVTAENGLVKEYAVTALRNADMVGLWNFSADPLGSYTVFEAVLVGGLQGDALLFDGFNDYVLVPDSDALTLADAGTIEAVVWINQHKPFAGIVHKGVAADFSDESYSLQFWNPTGTVRIGLFDNAGGYAYVDSSMPLDAKRWYYLTAAWDNQELALYINGEKDGSIAKTIGPVRDSSGALIIGAQLADQKVNSTYRNLALSGIVDRVQIFSRTLSEDEIADRYNAYFPDQGGALSAFILAATRSAGWKAGVLLALIVAALAVLYWRNRSRAARE